MNSSINHCARYILPERVSRQEILEALNLDYAVQEAARLNENVVLVDSFAWGLYTNGYMGFRLENNDIAIWQSDELFDPDQVMTAHSDDPQARFWWDFEATAERTLLEKVLGLRALQAVSEVALSVEEYDLQDANGKTQVFLQLVLFRRSASAHTPQLTQIKLTPVTGYDAEFARACELVEKLGGFEPRLGPIDSLLSVFR